jgi:hypothetical protein
MSTDPIKADIDAAKAEKKADAEGATPTFGTVTVNVQGKDEVFTIVAKPDALLLAELARTGSGDPEAFGVIAEFFEYTLGREGYRLFKKAVRAEGLSQEQLMEKLQHILEVTLARPTE